VIEMQLADNSRFDCVYHRNFHIFTTKSTTMPKFKIYDTLQEAISHEAETVAEIMYNDAFLRKALRTATERQIETDRENWRGIVESINAKLFINEDKLREIDRHMAGERGKAVPRRAQVLTWLKRILGLALITGLYVASKYFTEPWDIFTKFLGDAINVFGVLMLFGLSMIAVRWCFTPVKPVVNIEAETDLFELNPEQYREKHKI
jgi:hypothetical protein